MQGRLFIEDYEIDLSEGLTNQITYAVDDVRNFDSKSTPFTKTVILPGTSRNNAALGNIFEITTANFTIDGQANIGYNFNASKAAKCRLEINGLQVIKGVFRLLEIIKDGKFVEYEAQIVGELGGFVAKLANKRLEDLDFSVYDHTYDADTIANSWEDVFTFNITSTSTFTAATKKIKIPNKILSVIQVGSSITIAGTAANNGTFTVAAIDFRRVFWDRYTEITVIESLIDATDNSFSITFSKPFGTGFYYPLIDYGNVSTDKVNFQYTAFRPALFLREYVDKIITGAGYTWESSFFDTNFFKRLIIPNNSKGLFNQDETFYIQANTTGTFSASGLGLTQLDIAFPTSTLNNFTANGSNTIFTYTNPAPITTKIKLNIQGNYEKRKGATTLKLVIASTQATEEYDFPANSSLQDFDLDFEVTSNFLNTEDFRVAVIWIGGLNESGQVNITSCNFTVEKDPPGKVELALGQDVVINDGIPKGIYQKDFFASVLKMFNLIVTEDKFRENHMIIEPYPDFYLTSNYLDWSDKIARDRPMRIKPMSELNARFYQMKYKQDNDFYNESYRKKYNEGYGDRIYDTAYDFAKETETVELIFSSSALYGAAGTDKIYPAIYKKSGNEGFEDTIEHNIRIMQAKKIEGVSSWDMLNGSTVVRSQDYYGYAGHLDDPDAPASDINFGVPKELYFGLVSGDLSANLFNAYYSPYLAEITDKDSRMLTAEFRLTIQDIYDLNFQRFVYIDGALFRLSKVIDWNTSGDELTKVELLKVINLVY